MSHDKHCCNDQGGCCDTNGHHHHHDECCHDFKCFSEQLLHWADEAWKEVVYKKMKEEIEKKSGEHINELVSLTVTANRERWKKKMTSNEDSCCEKFSNDLKTLMSRCCDQSKENNKAGK